MVALAQNLVEQLALRVIVAETAPGDVGRRPDQRQRCAQFVAGVGHEGLLALPGALGRAQRLARQPPAGRRQEGQADASQHQQAQHKLTPERVLIRKRAPDLDGGRLGHVWDLVGQQPNAAPVG